MTLCGRPEVAQKVMVGPVVPVGLPGPASVGRVWRARLVEPDGTMHTVAEWPSAPSGTGSVGTHLPGVPSGRGTCVRC
jgi:hypothetical protein